MGSWGITMRESDYGLDLLDTIVTTQLKAADFSTFNVADTLEVIKADIMEEIRKTNRGSSAVELVFYFSECFSQNFTHGVLLLAECLADYCRTGDLIVTEYVGKNCDPVDHHIKEFVVTPVTSCQGLFNTVHRTFKKSTQQKPGPHGSRPARAALTPAPSSGGLPRGASA